jgi:hypothetical protein
MNHFFIFALPRSRTSWLANFLTHGPSFCHHDALNRCSKVEDLKTVLSSPSALRHIGDSDSALPLFAPQLVEQFPEAKAVFILRRRNEALASHLSYIERQPIPGAPAVTPQQVAEQFEVLEEALDNAMTKWTGQSRILGFDALEGSVGCQLIWDFLIPDEPFDLARWQLLHKLRVEPIARKMNIDWPRAARLMSTQERPAPAESPRTTWPRPAIVRSAPPVTIANRKSQT